MPCHKIWRHYGITYATYYKWKGKYGGLWASDLNHLKELSMRTTGSSGCTPIYSWKTGRCSDVIAKSFQVR